MGTSTTLQIQDTTVNGKKSNTRQTSKQSKAKTTTTRAKSTTAKPKKAPVAPKIDPHADEPQCAPIFAPKAPESPRWESCVASWADEPQYAPMPEDTFRPEPPSRKKSIAWCAEVQRPVLFRELAERLRMLNDKLEAENIDDFDLPDIARGLECLVSNVNFFSRVYIDGDCYIAPVPVIDNDCLNFAASTLYHRCRVIIASIDAALHELSTLLVLDILSSTETGKDELPLRGIDNPPSNAAEIEELPF